MVSPPLNRPVVEPSLEQRVSALENLVFVLRAERAAERAQQAPPPGEIEWLSVGRAAQLARVSKSAIYRAEREKRLRPSWRDGRHVLIDAAAVIERYVTKRG